MQKFIKLLISFSLAVSLLLVFSGSASALRCVQYDPLTGLCSAQTPNLLQGAHDCAAGYVPAANEIAIFTGTFYSGSCQAFPSGSDYPDFNPSGWYGAFSIQSIKIGSAGSQHNWFRSQPNYAGTALMLFPGQQLVDSTVFSIQSLLTL